MPSATALDITKLTDDQLTAELTAAANSDDEARIERVLAEFDRREAADARINELVAKGWTYRDAYAEAHDLDPAELDRQERAAMVASARQPGESLEQVVDRLYGEMTRARYVQAEDACRGQLLNAAGRAANVDPYVLFHGPAQRVRKYASDELRNWFKENGRLIWIDYKAQMLGRASDIAKAAKVDRDLGQGVSA
jgi:hypothetical protein